MKKLLLGVGLASLLGGAVCAQTVDTKASSKAGSKTSVSKNGGDAVLQSGTQLSGQLQNSLDVQKAKVGDQVVLKTTSAVKENGRVVVDKGSRLIGRVTEVQQKAKGNAASRIGVLFDRLDNGKMTLPINAVISSVTQARAQTSVADDMIDSDISGGASARGSTRSSSGGNGGLLGGATNTVGGVVNSTAQTVGGVTNTVGQTVGNTTQTVGGTLRGIQISQSASASAEGGSVLSLQGGNLRLEKGTTFNLRLNEAASVGNK